MGNPNEAPRFSGKLTRRAFNVKFAAPFLTTITALVAVATSCQRTDSDEAPGKKLLDEGSEALAKKAREAAGMGSPTAAPSQAKEMTPRPTMTGPDYQATTVAQQTEIAQLRVAAKTPEPAKPAEKPKLAPTPTLYRPEVQKPLPTTMAAPAKPAEKPKPVENGAIGSWKLIPLSYEELFAIETGVPGLSPAKGKEGYKRLRFQIAVKNISSALEVGGEMRDIEFSIQAAGGFTYRSGGQQGRFMGFLDGHWVDKIPPGYTVPFQVDEIEVPIVAKELKLVASNKLPLSSSRETPVMQQKAIWDIEKEFSTAEKAPKMQYLSPDTEGLRQVGKPLVQGPFIVTPSKIMMATQCTRFLGKTYWSWLLGIKFEVENKYGYDLSSPNAQFIAFGPDGRIWPGFSKIGLEGGLGMIPDVAPGIKKVYYAGGDVSSFNPDPDLRRCKPENQETFPFPQNLRLLLWLPEQPKIQAPSTWAVYKIENPSVSTNIYDGGSSPRSDILKELKKRFE